MQKFLDVPTNLITIFAVAVFIEYLYLIVKYIYREKPLSSPVRAV